MFRIDISGQNLYRHGFGGHGRQHAIGRKGKRALSARMLAGRQRKEKT